MSANRAPQQVTYEGQSYLLFDDLQDFAREVAQSKKAILRTDFPNIGHQMHELFRITRERFGEDSREAHAVVEARLHCAQCGVGYSKQLLTLLLVPFEKGPKPPSACPKCQSTGLLYLYQV